MMIQCAPAGLLAPTVFTWEKVPICEVGIYDDKFGQIHRHMLFQWAHKYNTEKNYAPILLEHHSFTWPFFGYIHQLYVKENFLVADLAFTKYGVETLIEYNERHMGSGWSVGVLKNHQGIGEVTLCRRPRVSTTHILSLNNIQFPDLDTTKYGMKNNIGDISVGDTMVSLIKDIISYETMNNQQMVLETLMQLQELTTKHNIVIPGGPAQDIENNIIEQ